MGFQITTRDKRICFEGAQEAASQQAGGLGSILVKKPKDPKKAPAVCFVLRLCLKMLTDALGVFHVLPAGNEEHVHKSSSE